jgi:hypothetical protein
MVHHFRVSARDAEVSEVGLSLETLSKSFTGEILRARFATLEYSDTADIIILAFRNFRYYKSKCFAFFLLDTSIKR